LPNENPDDFESFRTGLLNDLAPEGEVEGVLAQKIVADAWHLRRVPIFEATLYRRGSADLLASQARKAIAVRQHASTEKDWVLAALEKKNAEHRRAREQAQLDDHVTRMLEKYPGAFLMHIKAMKWESVDESVAAKLLQLAIEDDDRESELRKLALKCDALALD